MIKNKSNVVEVYQYNHGPPKLPSSYGIPKKFDRPKDGRLTKQTTDLGKLVKKAQQEMASFTKSYRILENAIMLVGN
jgi:hypothetical protein